HKVAFGRCLAGETQPCSPEVMFCLGKPQARSGAVGEDETHSCQNDTKICQQLESLPRRLEDAQCPIPCIAVRPCRPLRQQSLRVSVARTRKHSPRTILAR